MFNLTGSEIIVILLLALVVLGPEKLPDAIRRFTQTYSEFRKMSSGFQSELRSAFDEPMREMRETANVMRDAADPNRLVAEAEAEQRLAEEAARADEFVDNAAMPNAAAQESDASPTDSIGDGGEEDDPQDEAQAG